MAPFERAMVVSYRLHCDRCAICNHSAAICHRMFPTLKSAGGWIISGCSPWSRPLMSRSAEREHPRLTSGEIISEEFQPTGWAKLSDRHHFTFLRVTN